MTITTTPAPFGVPSENTGKLMTRYIKAHNRTTVVLSYSTTDAHALRMMAQSITLKEGKKPSLSLLSRRALQIYSDLLLSPGNLSRETDKLNSMVTRVPAPATTSKRKGP